MWRNSSVSVAGLMRFGDLACLTGGALPAMLEDFSSDFWAGEGISQGTD